MKRRIDVKVARLVAGLALMAGLVASAASCSSDHADPCAPGASIACTGPGGCAGGQVCNGDGSGYGSCDCASAGQSPESDSGSEPETGEADTGSASGSGSGGGGSPKQCPVCWKYWACLEDGTETPLIYFNGAQNSDGSCTLTPTTTDVSTVTLGCSGQTGKTSWSEPMLGTVDFDDIIPVSCNQT
jgi:hypothetical protein